MEDKLNILDKEILELINLKMAKPDKTIKQHTLDLLENLYKLKQLGYINDNNIYELVEKACIYHDIGKIKLPEEILNKKEPLTDEEYNLIKQHTNFGSVLMNGYCSDDICQMIQYHHENIDGSGYYRLTEIPLGSRIIRICDVYDAMTSIRPYHTGKSMDETMNYIRSHAGILFDESLVQLFSIIIQRKKEI